MKYLQDFYSYKAMKENIDGYELPFRVDLRESISTTPEELLNVIDAKELDVCSELILNPEEIDLRIELEQFIKTQEFLYSIKKLELTIGDVEKTTDFQTFLSVPMTYVCIYPSGSSNLQDPTMLLVQVWEASTKTWSKIRMFDVEDDFSKFYNELSSKTVEITKGGQTYIYKTDNSGNNWTLAVPKEGAESSINYQQMWDMMDSKDIKVKVLH